MTVQIDRTGMLPAIPLGLGLLTQRAHNLPPRAILRLGVLDSFKPGTVCLTLREYRQFRSPIPRRARLASSVQFVETDAGPRFCASRPYFVVPLHGHDA